MRLNTLRKLMGQAHKCPSCNNSLLAVTIVPHTNNCEYEVTCQLCGFKGLNRNSLKEAVEK